MEIEKRSGSDSSSNRKNKYKKKIDELRILTEYYSKLHLVSYSHLRFLNNIYVFVLIILTFSMGIFTISNGAMIDTNTELNQDSLQDSNSNITINNDSNYDIYYGIIDIIVAILIMTYKQVKLPENMQLHYNFFNNFRVLNSKINTSYFAIDTSLSSGKDYSKFEIIKDMANTFDNLIITSPSYPSWIIWKYGLEKFNNLNTDNGIILNVTESTQNMSSKSSNHKLSYKEKGKSMFINKNISTSKNNENVHNDDVSDSNSNLSAKIQDLLRKYLRKNKRILDEESNIKLEDIKEIKDIIKDIKREDTNKLRITKYNRYTKKKEKKKMLDFINDELDRLKELERNFKRTSANRKNRDIEMGITHNSRELNTETFSENIEPIVENDDPIVEVNDTDINTINDIYSGLRESENELNQDLLNVNNYEDDIADNKSDISNISGDIISDQINDIDIKNFNQFLSIINDKNKNRLIKRDFLEL